ncbi:MAG: T9SS type A sorting domain-containing protein [Bacteroidales bacterium]|nr:T9SS type A sorting domain-containing protein [Bacteroidales bacterium]
MKNFAVQRPLFITRQLQQNFGNPVIVYPNPGDGRVFVDFGQPANAVTIKAYSINGGLMRQWQFNQAGNEPKPLNTQLAPGIYLLQINMDGRLYYNKLIVQ